MSKGGVLKIYNQLTGELFASDCTYWAKLSNDIIISSQNLDRRGFWEINENDITVKSNFIQVNQRVQSTWLFILFRLFTLTFGRLKIFSYWIKDSLVYILIRRRRKIPLCLIRRVRFEKDKIHINDRIEMIENIEVRMLQCGEKFTTVHMGSSRYFQNQELKGEVLHKCDFAKELMKNQSISINRVLNISKI